MATLISYLDLLAMSAVKGERGNAISSNQERGVGGIRSNVPHGEKMTKKRRGPRLHSVFPLEKREE